MLRGRCLCAGPAKGAEILWGAFLVELVLQCTHSRLDKQAAAWTTVEAETGKCRHATKLLWACCADTSSPPGCGETASRAGETKKNIACSRSAQVQSKPRQPHQRHRHTKHRFFVVSRRTCKGGAGSRAGACCFVTVVGEPPAGWLNIDHKQHAAREKHPAPFNGEARWYLRPTKERNVTPSVAGAKLSTLGWVG